MELPFSQYVCSSTTSVFNVTLSWLLVLSSLSLKGDGQWASYSTVGSGMEVTWEYDKTVKMQ